jgi:UDP-glucose 4-epimerase
MSRILITGSEGFIGGHALTALRSAGHEIFTLDVREGSGKNEHYTADIRKDDLDLIVSKIKPDSVVHLAAQVVVTDSFLDPINDLEINALGTLRLIQASINSKCKNFCYIHSGGAVYDSAAKLPLSEESPEHPVSPYGLTKKLGEGYVRVLSEANKMGWSSLAYSNVYGPVISHQKGVIYEFWKALTSDSSPTIFGKEVTRDFLFIDDAVRAIVLAAESPINTRVNISSGKEISLISLFEKISRILNASIEPRVLPARTGEILRSCLDNQRAFKILNWTPIVDLDSGLGMSIPKEGDF